MKAAVSIILAIVASLSFGQEKLLINTDFAAGDGGWKSLGQTAQIAVTHEAGEVGDAKGALKFSYGVNKGEFNALILPAEPGSLAGAASLSFQVKTDATTPMVVSLQKANGARYISIFTAPKDIWQTVELSMSDFNLSDGKDDPKDPEGALLPEHIASIAIGDLAQMFAQGEQPAFLDMAGIKMGDHHLLLDRFAVSKDPLPASFSKNGQEVRIDDLVHPQVNWFGLGGVAISNASGDPLSGKGIKAQYNQMPGKAIVLAHGVKAGNLKGAQSLNFEIASTQAATLAVQVEQTDGAKYNMMVTVPAGTAAAKQVCKFSDFKVADDSAVKDGHIDMSLAKTILIIDLSGVINQANHINTLWVGPLIAKLGS